MSDVMRVLVFGNAGQLGRDLTKVFAADAHVTGYDLPQVSIADPRAVHDCIVRDKPGIVINAAAYTNVEGAEDHADEAFTINEGGARIVAEASRAAGLPIVHISTDFVYDGRKRTPYEPADAPNPLSVYGKSKLAGDEAVREANPRHFILRTAWLYGPGGNNFVEKIIGAAKKNPSLKVVSEEIGSPTHTWDLAEAARSIATTHAYGLYHAVNAGQVSRDKFAEKILALAGINTPVHSCAAGEFPVKAARPLYSVLSTATLEAACGYRFRPWEDALAHYIQRRATAA
jgi:dTDP-4-dehydrorhamnose reductase